MADVKVKLRLSGLNQLMRSEPVQAEVLRRARRIQAAAGDNFEVVSRPHRWTARAYVQPKNYAGRREEAKHKRLTSAVDAGRSNG